MESTSSPTPEDTLEVATSFMLYEAVFCHKVTGKRDGYFVYTSSVEQAAREGWIRLININPEHGPHTHFLHHVKKIT